MMGLSVTLVVAGHERGEPRTPCVQVILKAENTLAVRSTKNFNLKKCRVNFLVSAVVSCLISSSTVRIFHKYFNPFLEDQLLYLIQVTLAFPPHTPPVNALFSYLCRPATTLAFLKCLWLESWV